MDNKELFERFKSDRSFKSYMFLLFSPLLIIFCSVMSYIDKGLCVEFVFGLAFAAWTFKVANEMITKKLLKIEIG